jgi:hypothetical protein
VIEKFDQKYQKEKQAKDKLKLLIEQMQAKMIEME